MASTQSSAQSSLPISQLIDQIINTKQDAPDFDLDQLIAYIDGVLGSCKANQGKSSKRDKSKVDWLPSSSDAAKISEGISENVKKIATQISEYSGDKRSTAIAVLNAVGNIHWVGLGFLLVATVLERVDTIKNNKMECFDLLSSMNALAKVVRQLKEFPRAKDKMQTQINESIACIVEGAILCCLQMKSKRVKRFFNASKDRDELIALRSKVDEMYRRLDIEINVQSLSILENNFICNQPPVPSVDYAVGIQQQIDEVVKLLQWENDTPSLAVVVHGIGGSGKTTLADAVYDSLRDNLKGWKYSKITLIQHLEEHPDVRQLQSLILQDLTGAKKDVRDLQSGRQSLKEIMENEPIFLYIDNALFIKPLQELLPREITNPKKLRLLVTARKSNISYVMEDCKIKCEIHPIEPLSLDAAIEVLCRKIDWKRDANIILEQRPQVKEIAQKCSCCPLFLEVVGGFLRRQSNEVEAYESFFKWMENGEAFSGNSDYSFQESWILFAYQQLESSAQEAFLDICSFFYDWEWEKVECIVGAEVMKCLKEGTLIKEKIQRDYKGKSFSQISIHDLLLQVGRNKSKDNRFRCPEDFTKALQNDKLPSQIKGAWLTYSGREVRGPIDVPTEVLDAMSGTLRVFAMGKWTIVKEKCSKSFDELRFLQAPEVPNLPMDISKLSRLTYMDCCLEDTMKMSQLKNLSTLKVLEVSKPPDTWKSNEISEVGYSNKLLGELVLKQFRGTGISNLVNLCYLKKLRLLWCDNLMELPESLGKLQSLQELYLDGCMSLKQLPPGFGTLKTLAALSLSGCSSLQELPIDFVELSSLQYLDLSCCQSLQELPSNFEKLISLHNLQLQGCSTLLKLPERLGNLPSLTAIDSSYCKKLSSLPQSLGGMTSLLMSDMSFHACSSLTELPEETSWLSEMKRISFSGCSSLKRIPAQFSKLTGLETLDMSKCRSLSTLPQGFGELRSLQTLYLNNCDKLEELCDDFYCLGALKELYLSGCCSLTKLPNCFGQLGCLEKVDLSECSNLAKLSDDFYRLPSLIRLDLSNCKRLVGEWMDCVGATQSLWYVDISGSEGMSQRWMEMKREKEEWQMLVVTESSSKDTNGTRQSLVLEKIIWKIFSEEGLLTDALQRPFCSSSLASHARLILILQRYSVIPEEWRLLESNLQRLERNSKASAIIYVGRDFNALPSELAERIVAYTPLNSLTDSFLKKIYHIMPVYSSPAMFACTIDGVEKNAVKYLSTWEGMSYLLNEVEMLTRNPRESNVELLRKLFVTQETDFLLRNNEQVKVNDLEGKVVLLLRTSFSTRQEKLQISTLEDVYLKLQRSSDYRAEVVWIPRVREHNNPEEYGRAVTSVPWPMVPHPWLINESYFEAVSENENALLVVDEKGSISCKDAMPMILRWGIKAYPFSASREKELRKAEWEGLNFSAQSSLEFVFQNLELFQSRAKEALLRGEMIFVCAGPINKMLDFVPELNCALTKLESVVQVFYVGDGTYDPFHPYQGFGQEGKEEYEKKRNQMCSITSLSFSHVHKFWNHLKCLWYELGSQGVDEKTVEVRRMVFAFVRACEWRLNAEGEDEKGKGIRIVGVDEKGEMINGRVEEMVQLLCQSDKEEEHHKLLGEMKSEGFVNVLQRRWADGKIHLKHHPHHPLVRLDPSYLLKPDICSACSCSLDWYSLHYRCSVCEKYEMCNRCFEG